MPAKKQHRPKPKANPAFREAWGKLKNLESQGKEARFRDQVRAAMRKYPDRQDVFKPFLAKKLTGQTRRDFERLLATMPLTLKDKAIRYHLLPASGSLPPLESIVKSLMPEVLPDASARGKKAKKKTVDEQGKRELKET